MTVYLTITAVQGYQQSPLVQSISRIPELEELHIVTGSIDMLARFRVRDQAHLRQLLIEKGLADQGRPADRDLAEHHRDGAEERRRPAAAGPFGRLSGALT